MREIFVYAALAVSFGLALYTVTTRRPRWMVLGAAALGVVQSAFFLVVGFELLALWNFLFTVAAATLLQLYSALFGTGATAAAESERTRSDWIYGLGTALNLGAIVGFGVSEMPPGRLREGDFSFAEFSRALVDRFPALTFIFGLVLFLSIVTWSTIGRPGWKKTGSEESR